MWVVSCLDFAEYNEAFFYYLDIKGDNLTEVLQETIQSFPAHEIVLEVRLTPWHNTSPEFLFNEMAYMNAIIITNIREITVERYPNIQDGQ